MPLPPVVDLAPARLVPVCLVRLIEQRAHVDLFARDREAVRIELREIEDVADQPLEPARLRLDGLE